MRNSVRYTLLVAAFIFLGDFVICQEVQPGDQNGAQQQVTIPSMTPEQRATATRTFLGLGPEPDKAAAARGGPLFQQTCAFCHGPQARGATGSNLITAEVVLDDDHGEHLVPFLKKGLPDKGMPAFATMSDSELKDVAEFIHLQVEEVANRGAYHVLNILVGDRVKGRSYVETNCASCHGVETFTQIGSRFRSPEQLQKEWIWPARSSGAAANQPEVTATVETPNGNPITGRVIQVSDFRITLLNSSGTHVIDRGPGVIVHMSDPLAAHQDLIMTMTNDDMHNVTAYLDSLK